MDLIVDGNDAKIFSLSGNFNPQLVGEKINIGFEVQL